MKNYILEVKLLDADDGFKSVMKRFGMSNSGELSRTIMVRGDMPLWSLHYALTAAFGFLNEHLHRYELFEDDLLRITESSTKEWCNQIGELFKSPTRDENDDFWADDYQKGSFQNWRRKKYSFPFVCHSKYLTSQDSKNDFQRYLDRFDDKFQINQYGYVIPEEVAHFDSEVYRFVNLPFENIKTMFEYSPFTLLETLTIDKLAKMFKHIKYLYDYGDGWEFDIAFKEDYISCHFDKELVRPLMLKADGLNLVEDVGGLDGYQRMLIVLFNLKPINPRAVNVDNKYIDINGEFYEFVDSSKECFLIDEYEMNPKQLLRWANSLEWSKEMPNIDNWF